jgi:N-acetylmuramoyl-L-alanine amidase
MRGYLKIFFLVLIYTTTSAQRLYKISVNINGEEKELSYIVNHDLDYVSAKELGNLLGAQEFYNSETSKLELKFTSSTLRITGRNQFVVIQNRENNSQNVLQIPISTLLIKDDIFIPVVYMLDYISKAGNIKLVYDDRSKNLKAVSSQPVNKSPVVETKTESKNEPIVTNSKIYDVYGIGIEEKANGTLIVLKTNRAIRVPRYSISNGMLYVFLSGASVAPGLENKAKPTGLIKSLRQSNISSRNNQLEFSLKEGYSSVETFRDPQTNDLIITVHNKMFVAGGAEIKSKWDFDCIVIDAGHGGKDPGTIGVTGNREKDINLAVALKLGKLIENDLPGVKVVYTRNKDEFIELYKRGKIANEAGGKLFVSIHCNSTETKDNGHRGFEVYLLRPGKTKEAIRIAEFENSVIKYEENPNRYDKLTDENFILVSMAHSQYMRYSESFSDFLNQTWKSFVEVPALGVKQAGFYVLVGASMPSVLIETGFLSNRKDEAYLASKTGQNSIAETIFNSIKKYKEFYEKEISN